VATICLVSQLLSALGIDPVWRGPATILLIAIVAFVSWYAIRFGAGQVAGRVLARQPEEADAVLPQIELERRVRTLERTRSTSVQPSQAWGSRESPSGSARRR
jgi:hypothetical protein